MTAFLIFLAVMGVALVLVVVAIALLVPAATEAAERARIEREAWHASWEIHQRATKAFSDLLDASRHDGDES